MRPTARTVTIPAPVGGLNTRDSLAAMQPTDAVVMANYFPAQSGIKPLYGTSSFATFTGIGKTLLVYNGTASSQLFVAVDTTNDAIINATAGGAISTPVVGGSGPTVQSVTNTIFDYVNFSNTAGNYLVAVNGTNTPLQYDGSSWTASTITGSGLTATNLRSVIEYAERLWWMGAGFDVWYLDVQAVTGTATRLNLGSLFGLGGKLSVMCSWSADSSSLLAEFIAFVSDKGEVVVFSGTNPAEATAWQRVAHFQLTPPLGTGQRTWARVGGDALLATKRGLISMRGALLSKNPLNDEKINFAAKIGKTWSAMVSEYQDHSWKVVAFQPSISASLGTEDFYVLVMSGQDPQDLNFTGLIMNAETRAWTTWSDSLWCMGERAGVLYGCPSEGNIERLFDISASVLSGSAVQAFNYFGDRTSHKFVNLARMAGGGSSMSIGFRTDFSSTTEYDSTSVDTSKWVGVNGNGYALALAVSGDLAQSNPWAATDFVYEQSGEFV
jgi:hypothetical protein